MITLMVLAFVACFVLGPALCAVLLKLPATAATLGVVGGAVVTAAALALLLSSSDPSKPVSALPGLWLAWIFAVALVALSVSKRGVSPPLQRRTFVRALLTTTLPWFGLATARALH